MIWIEILAAIFGPSYATYWLIIRLVWKYAGPVD